MLSCKKCGAVMSGVDIVCKKCGTPWGKTHKSRKTLYLFFIFIILASTYVYFNYDIFKTFFSSLTPPVENSNLPESEHTPAVPDTIPSEPLEVSPESIPETVTVPEIIPPVFSSISASSSLPSSGAFSYSPEMLIDNNLSTAWLEGTKGSGLNENILFSAETEQTVSKLKIFNGYQKNNITYINNNRVKKIRLEFSDGTSTERILPNQNYSESLNGVDILLDYPVKTSFVKITILDVYRGVYYNDTAINKIEIL